MANTTDLLNEYIVFEPDQVLTNDHLNELFNYLDNQNRLTRNKFIGIGIVCGLEISSDGTSTITISKGCGITSQGYSIVLEDNTPISYTAYLPYAGVPEPVDLPFQFNGPLPFYQAYNDGRNIYQLMTADEVAASTDNPVTLFSQNSLNLNNYVVVLFLEAAETDLKNCSMQDCNNNGEKIDFNIRPLLVNINDLPANISGKQTGAATNVVAPEISLLRYNVPYADINNSDDVINGFKKIIDGSSSPIISQLQAAYTWCYNNYNSLFNEAPFDFTSLQGLENSILQNNPFQIQYLYDYFDDLAKAYYEFREKALCLTNTTCCPDENCFPLHLVLGDAIPNANVYTKSSYRQYFIHSPASSSSQCTGSGELKFLFDRMRLMLNEFNFPVTQNLFVGARLANFPINRTIPNKITPSLYESFALSERAIPYYYLNANNGFDIYSSWNYRKSIVGKSNYNLGYNSDKYPDPAPPDTILNPLLYDIERFNFFRIEGHIGKNFQTVLSDLLTQVNTFNLPFDVVAVSADMLAAGATLPQCNMIDLDMNYKLIVSEFASKIHMIYNFILNIPYPYDDTKISPYFVTFNAARTQALKTLNQLVSFNPGTTYVKGNFIKAYYSPVAQGTFGAEYLATTSPLTDINQIISNLNFSDLKAQLISLAAANASAQMPETAAVNPGIFINPIVIGNPIWFITVPYMINLFIGSLDNLMGYLTSNDVALFDTNTFNTTYYTPFTGSIASFKDTLTAWMEAAITSSQGQTDSLAEDSLLDEFIYELDMLLSSSLDEKLGMLKNEYTNRLNNYQSQLNFLNYFQQNPGLEHKAGVPKGGTFVLVYHQQPSVLTAATAASSPITAPLSINAASLAAVKDFLVKNIATINTITESDVANILSSSANSGSTAPQYNLTNGAVIADFYIPYLCCSNCPPVAYVLQSPPVQTTPMLSMNPANMCSDLTQPVSISATPSDSNGQVTATANILTNAIIKNADGSWSFDPTKLAFPPTQTGQALILSDTLIYTLNNVSSAPPLPVNVFRHPSSAFTGQIKPSPIPTAVINMLSLQATETDPGLQYNWTIIVPPNTSGASVSNIPSIPNPVVSIGNATSATVTLQVINDKLCSETSQPQLISIPTILMATQFCNIVSGAAGQAYPVQINVTPAGGKLSGVASPILTQKGDGTWWFDPTTAAIPAGAANMNITLTYTVNGSVSAPFTITVYRSPSVGFSFAKPVGASGTIMQFTPAETDATFKYHWDIMVNKTIALTADTRVYQLNTVTFLQKNITVQTVDVTLTVTNGNCTAQSKLQEFTPTQATGKIASPIKTKAVKKAASKTVKQKTTKKKTK